MTAARRTLLAEFETTDACAHAIAALRERGFDGVDAYIPYPDREIERALGQGRSRLPGVVLLSGLIGASVGYLILYWTTVVDYPIYVSGYPLHPVVAFVPITFETAVLFAGIAAFVGSFVLSGLPKLYHPIDSIPEFVRASIDRFFVAVLVDDSEEESARGTLTRAGAVAVFEHGPAAPALPSGAVR